MRSFVFLAALPLLVSAWSEHTLLGRATSGNSTSCDTDDKVCGAFCIPGDYTCCPDLEGGCPSTSVCQKGDNGVYGCCPNGKICNGDGGSEFLDDDDSDSGTSTSTSDGSSPSSTAASSNGARHVVFSQGLALAALGAGAVAFL
ncbi:uncharacterized protein Z518_01868 [Rhinocladiella mackenziei CBS 650.93]|uniref:GPI anchored serine-threonine rich protein n=1 Tax=Rhinocladiella mackenziei CBS 650.93 TaxID=1442369 RepID=A0A0D2JDF7_9EURO|nr:uncharacterized protein Z518_01868 [Rhinocladiella mackenziei CBS 650.93]KIX07215.1 hypothetical protein Z518_01868 [Rhinocladiella mackenziei CBS 650.93]